MGVKPGTDMAGYFMSMSMQDLSNFLGQCGAGMSVNGRYRSKVELIELAERWLECSKVPKRNRKRALKPMAAAGDRLRARLEAMGVEVPS